MAINYPKSIESMVLIGVSTRVTTNVINGYKNDKFEKWPKDRIDSYLRSYKTVDEIKNLWTKTVKGMEYFNNYYPNDITSEVRDGYTKSLVRDGYKQIKCPLLVLHGDKVNYFK